MPPIGRFASFTPLNTLIDWVLMQIKDEGALTFLGKLNGNPSKRSKDKYCRFHHDHGYDTSDFYDLKQQIEALIRQGKLQRFIGKERMDQPQETLARRENKHPRPPLGDIRMIVGGTTTFGSSKKARKTYPRMAWIDDPIIGFIEEDARRLHHSYDDALVVSFQVGDYNTRQVLVDNGSSTNILYYLTFQ